MGSDQPAQPNASEPDLRREILRDRKFSLADVIGMEGGSFLKGESPVPKLVQAITEIDNFIHDHLVDPSGSLHAVLQEWVKSYDDRVSRHLDKPLLALVEILETIRDNPYLLYELVRQVDIKWGQMYDERPYFQHPGQLPHRDDEYTHESVDRALRSLLEQLKTIHDAR